ncbi:MAG TPA: endo-1,4-beta-xylanase [Planctomycetota bacterium]|nr:endo-1,4-beta-xylanase [Planctomycetota bacterium]
MTDVEILDGAEDRIREHRSAETELHLTDGAGKPLANVRLRVRLLRHAFKLGCNAYCLGAIDDPRREAAYEERFAALLNYATLPFYWASYEQRPGETRSARLATLADWCRDRGITTKGHPLVWHETFPEWARPMEDADVLKRLRERVTEIVSAFRGRIDTWDVVNEATVSARFDNAVGRWMSAEGAAACVSRCLDLAHGANPQATLLYNDFNVSEAYETLLQTLCDTDAPMHVVGIQSHMHKGTWPIARAWDVCETYARFDRPLHFTETTVLSGRFKTPDDNDWHRVHTDWPTTSEGEAAQMAYAQRFYTTLFSHPAVEAITWWDFSDHGAWQGAPAGLVRDDMTPKPLYDWLVDAFHRRWSTDARLTTDASGVATLRGFFGDCEVTGKRDSGETFRTTFTFDRRGSRRIELRV